MMIIFIRSLFIPADGAGGDLDSGNITDLLNEPGEFNGNFYFKQ